MRALCIRSPQLDTLYYDVALEATADLKLEISSYYSVRSSSPLTMCDKLRYKLKCE
jgi:hypothetical protein